MSLFRVWSDEGQHDCGDPWSSDALYLWWCIVLAETFASLAIAYRHSIQRELCLRQISLWKNLSIIRSILREKSWFDTKRCRTRSKRTDWIKWFASTSILATRNGNIRFYPVIKRMRALDLWSLFPLILYARSCIQFRWVPIEIVFSACKIASPAWHMPSLNSSLSNTLEQASRSINHLAISMLFPRRSWIVGSKFEKR